MAKSSGRGFKDMNVDSREPRVDDLVDLFKPHKQYEELRLVGDVYAYAQRWITIHTENNDRPVNVPRVALNFDRETGTFDETIEDPYENLPNEVQTSTHYYVNAIVRQLQDDEPKRKPSPTKKERRRPGSRRRIPTLGLP